MDSAANATWTFRRRDTDAGLGTIERPFVSSRASAIWEASGPDEARERWCMVKWQVTAGGITRDSPADMRVFFDWLEVTAVGPHDAPAPHVDFTLFHDGAPAEGRAFRTGGDGVRRVDNVPPVDYVIRWPVNYTAVWQGEAASPRRRCLVTRKPYTLGFDSPVATTEAAPHRQWVNDQGYPQRALCGNRETVRVRVVDGAAPEDSPYYLKIEYAAQNLLRANGDRHPDGVPGTRLSAGVYRYQGTLRGGVGSVEVPVGSVGGDRVKLSVGSTTDCNEAVSWLENWRRVDVLTEAGQTLSPSVQTLVNGVFDGIFVQLADGGNQALPANAAVKRYTAAELGSLPSGKAGTDACVCVEFVPGADETRLPEGRAVMDGLLAIRNATRLGTAKSIALYLVDRIPGEVRPRTFTAALTAPTQVARFEATRGLFFCRTHVRSGGPGWTVTASLAVLGGDVAADKLEVTSKDAGKTLEVRVAPAEQGGEGSLGARMGSVRKLKIKLVAFEYKMFKGQSLGQTAICLERRPATADHIMAQAVVHEILHALDEVRPRLSAEFPDRAHPHHVTDQGFAGDHCIYGLPNAVPAPGVDYLAQFHRGQPPLRGTCMMWGAGVADDEDGQAPTALCPRCKRSLLTNNF